MNRVLITGGTVVTLGPKNRIINDGAVLIVDNVIDAVGKASVVKKKARGAKVVDAKNGVIMPGFINTHMHLYSTFACGISPKQPPATNFPEVLERLWFPLDKALNAEDVKYSAMVPYVDCIRCGTTTIIDHHESQGLQAGVMDVLERAARRMGIRSVLCLGASDRFGKGLEGVEENVRFIKNIQSKRAKGDDLVAAMMGLHALFTVNQETLNATAQAARELGVGVHVHVAEDSSDQHFNKKNYGMSAVKRLKQVGVLGDKSIAVHCVHVDKNDMKLLASTGTNVVNNPQSNMNNAVGIAKVKDMMDCGIPVALGSDGMTSNMCDEVRAALLSQRLRMKDPSAFFVEACTMLLENNRALAGRYFKKDIGVLKKGAYGDVIVLDYLPSTPFNMNTFLGHFIYGLCGTTVRTTVVNGKVLMQDRKLCGINEKRLMTESSKQAATFWKRF